jgi:hypothetical protein
MKKTILLIIIIKNNAVYFTHGNNKENLEFTECKRLFWKLSFFDKEETEKKDIVVYYTERELCIEYETEYKKIMNEKDIVIKNDLLKNFTEKLTNQLKFPGIWRVLFQDASYHNFKTYLNFIEKLEGKKPDFLKVPGDTQ